ncbi:MAG: ATP-binding protein, partial [Lachnospiraceae bacterium]|nr:ATP-binding protein [Lachnospiraceae bacterium]
VNMCEMKYYSKPYKVDKDDHEKIIKREELLSTMIAPGEVVHNTLITTYDPVKNEYIGVFSKIITLPDLFTN